MASHTDLVHRLFDRLNAHDVPGLRELWIADGVERFPDRECRGADEIGRYMEALFGAVPDFHMEIQGIAEQGDEVFVRWHLTGTHTGASGFQGLDPTGKSLAVDGIDHVTVRDGKLASNFVVFDQMQFARQIGLLPPDGSTADRAVKAAFNAKTKIADLIAQQRSG
jgi:predicted ester cyclase